MSGGNSPTIENEDLIPLLLSNMHQFTTAVEEMIREYAQFGRRPGPYIIFSDVFGVYVGELLDSGQDDAELRRLFYFVEYLVASGDVEVQNTIFLALLEDRIVDGDKRLERARPYMGPATTDLYTEWFENPNRRR